ncbi:MAG: helix-hairpin-helix domain-containing protein [Ignavibacteriales bacterium]|nr:helix-hairpin-helix domain-containing protein [Ignavibacteriales bacterium]MCF8306365.1 helix-hairpin-helix domain-containing protein [Ignavibacteriales bacterium]MCF8435780.1 helix-hairpin-helix domain-containing protein [Ignavibacteriales bacterium]
MGSENYSEVDSRFIDSLTIEFERIAKSSVIESKKNVDTLDSKTELLDFSKNSLLYSNSGKLSLGSININTAGVDDLDKLPGIGIKTAEKIIEYRSEHGKFNELSELMNVKGIGIKKFEKIKIYITL